MPILISCTFVIKKVMGKIVDLLEYYSVESIKQNFTKIPTELLDFGYDVNKNSTIHDLDIIETDYVQKYSGNLESDFILIIKRSFTVKAKLDETPKSSDLLREDLVYEGRHFLRNMGNGEVEGLPDMGNVIWNLCNPEDSRVKLDSKFVNFDIENFPI